MCKILYIAIVLAVYECSGRQRIVMENTYLIVDGVCVIPEGTTRLTGAYDLRDVFSAKSVRIPKTVTEIEDGAFAYCSNLEEIVVEDGNPCYDSRGGCNAIIETSTNRLVVGAVTTVIPDTVTIIGDRAFAERDLTEIVIPDSVEVIEDQAFTFCSNLHSVVLSKSLKSIGFRAFEQCDITCLEIPASVESMTIDSFDRGHLEYIRVDPANPRFDSRDDCNAIIITEANALVCGSKNTVIPQTVEAIWDRAFEYTKIEEISIPASVIDICHDAFSCCLLLKKVSIDEGDYLCIHNRAFVNCVDLKEINLPESLDMIFSSAFKQCYSLQSLHIPAYAETIEPYIIEGCSNLNELTVAQGNRIYDSREGCNAIIETATDKLVAGCIKTVIPESVKVIGEGAFTDLSTLTELIIPASVTAIEDYAFSHCSHLKTVVIKGPVKHLNESAFAGCVALEKLSLPVGVKKISASFEDCKLKEISVPKGKTGYYMRRLPEHLHRLIVERK